MINRMPRKWSQFSIIVMGMNEIACSLSSAIDAGEYCIKSRDSFDNSIHFFEIVVIPFGHLRLQAIPLSSWTILNTKLEWHSTTDIPVSYEVK